jgi:hypothetical protein
MSSPIKFIDNRQYHKSNYSDAMKYVIPSMYYEEDYALKNKEIDVLDQLINSHLNIIGNINSILFISGVAGTVYSGMNTPEGIAPFFIKQNNLTDIDTNDFERKILLPLDTSLKDFNSSAEFRNYLNNTLLPGIRTNNPTLTFAENATKEQTHNYLITNLSWFYFLNRSGSLTYNPSSYVLDTLVNNIYQGKPLTTNDGIRGLTEYIWRNYTTQSWSSIDVIPDDFLPIASNTSSQFTSGTQQLSKLNTLVDVLYSPLYIDDGDVRVRDAIEDYLQNSYLITQKYLQGPFIKLIKAMSFAFADYSNQVDRLESLYDIDECPDEYLPLLANLIGWKLFGSEPDRWRLQIANAVDIYRAVGTKKCVKLVADSVFGQDVLGASSLITEMWESYIPFLIQYSLATESPLLQNFSTWTQSVAQSLGVTNYSLNSFDENIKMCVDKILTDLVTTFPDNFILAGSRFRINRPDFVFEYRNKINKIPPFEEIPYYTTVKLTKDMVSFIVDKLVCFGVPISFADKVGDYILKYTLENNEDYSLRNSFLMFTPSSEYPPNWDSVIKDLSDTKTEYLSLWNGKSSHFQIVIDTSSFNFGKTSLEADSAEILKITSQTIKEFSPAKAMPDIIARSSAEDFASYLDAIRPYIRVAKQDYAAITYASGASIAGFATSAIAMKTYKRGLTPTSTATFSRFNADSLSDSLIRFDALASSTLPRRSHRRRDLKFILPKGGFYDRTGFNMPVSYDYNFSTAKTPLGLIPSSMTFVPIPDYNNIPEIYSRCNNLDSSNSYYGYSVSNTVPARGGSEVGPTKNLVIMAGQSNMNGKGEGYRDSVGGVNYWDIEASAFVDTVIPFTNTQLLNPLYDNSFTGVPFSYGSDFWGPEVRFCELLQKSELAKNTYIVKFAADNSLVVNSSSINSWCPSNTFTNALYKRFNNVVDAAVNSLGGSSNIRNVSLLWSQGESEAGTGQENNASAIAFSAATAYFLDTVKAKFPSPINFKILRSKIADEMGQGSEPDRFYFPNGYWEPSPALLDLGGGTDPGLAALFASYGLAGGQNFLPGSFGTWSWSSTSVVRQGQENLNADQYGQLLNFDDINGFVEEPSFESHSSPISPPGVLLFSNLLGNPLYNISGNFSAENYTLSNIHFNDESLDEIGERYFYAWLGTLARTDSFLDRGQLDKFVATLHYIQEQAKVVQASAYYADKLTEYAQDAWWKNNLQSYANSATIYSGAFPNSFDNYINFKFGRDFHKLYEDYIHNFNRHRIGGGILNLNGPTIFGHTFGSILYNSDLLLRGNFASQYPQYITSSLDNVYEFYATRPLFSISGNPSGTFVASTIEDATIYRSDNPTIQKEFRNSGIISYMEFCHPSGCSPYNSFAVIDIDDSEKVGYKYKPLIHENVLIKQKSRNSTSRMIFDIGKYAHDSNNGFDVSTNFLTPDHEFKLSLKSLISTLNGEVFGGGAINFWIHTKPERNKIWTFMKNGEWEQHDASSVTNSTLVQTYCHQLSMPELTRDLNSSSIRCNNFRLITNQNKENDTIASLDKSDFNQLELTFNTRNRYLSVPADYFENISNHVHRLNQRYVIEIFSDVKDENRFTLFYDLNLIDLTLNKWSKPFITGTPNGSTMGEIYCKEYRVDVNRNHLQSIIRYFNEIAGAYTSEFGYANRSASYTSGVYEVSGGSRINYVESPFWNTYSVTGTTGGLTNLTYKN